MSENATAIDETLVCQFCHNQTLSSYNFCMKCYKQIKCIECGSKTIDSADFCLGCGKSLVVVKANDKAPNRYTRNVKREGENYEEHTHFELSDDAIGKIAPFVIDQTMPERKSKGSLPPKINGSNQGANAAQSDLTDFEDVTNYGDEAKTQDGNNTSDNGAEKSSEHKSTLTEYFKKDNGLLVATENDFKGKNWAEQQRNFIVLFTRAYKEIMQVPVSNKDVIREAAKKLNLADPNNFTKYLDNGCKEFMTELSNGLELNSKGTREANRLMKIMGDENAQPGYVYTARNLSVGVKKPRMSKEDKERYDGWLSDDVNLGQLNVKDVKTGRDAALLAFWILTNHLKKAKALPIYSAAYFLKAKYTTISVTSDAFTKAVTKNKDSHKYFQKNEDNEYFLSTVGEKLVEDWISGTKKIQNDEQEQ